MAPPAGRRKTATRAHGVRYATPGHRRGPRIGLSSGELGMPPTLTTFVGFPVERAPSRSPFDVGTEQGVTG